MHEVRTSLRLVTTTADKTHKVAMRLTAQSLSQQGALERPFATFMGPARKGINSREFRTQTEWFLATRKQTNYRFWRFFYVIRGLNIAHGNSERLQSHDGKDRNIIKDSDSLRKPGARPASSGCPDRDAAGPPKFVTSTSKYQHRGTASERNSGEPPGRYMASRCRPSAGRAIKG